MASNSRIKGITIELEGKTTGLEKALKDVTSESIDLQSELRDVEKLLKFDPGNTEAIAQKQQILAKQLENTTEKLNRLKGAQEQVEQQFANGDIGEKQYRSFRREIEYTEKSIKDLDSKIVQLSSAPVTDLKQEMSKVDDATSEASEGVKDLGNELVNLAAGMGAVDGISGVIEKALDTSSLNTKIELTFDVSEESKQSVMEAINTVNAYGVDAEESLEGVRRQWALNKDASDESNASVVKSAAAIVAAYAEIDFTELIQETNEMSKSLNIGNEDALAMVNSLLKIGFPPDQLDIITEYGSQLARAGYNAEEIQGIMAAGVETGSWNIDVLLDGLKEGRIVLSEFGQGVDETTTELFEKIGVSGEQLQQWGRDVASGGEAGKKAMQEVAQAVANVEDKTLQNQIGTTVWGTLFEENGTKITDTILDMNNHLVTAKENQDGLNESISTLDSDPAIKMQQALSELTTALTPLLSAVAEIISKVAEWIQENPTLAATITAIVTTLGILMGIFMALAPIITAITTAASALGISIGAIAAPVLAVVAVIAGLVAIGVVLYKNWDEIKAKCSEIWENIKNVFSTTVTNIKNAVVGKFNDIKSSISNKMSEVKSTISNIWNSVMNFFRGINLAEIGRNIIQGLINGVKNMAGKLVDSVKGVVDGAIEGAKNLLGIHSPSRVFMEFGEYTGEGFINGINDMKNAVAKAGQDMANASIPTISQPDFSSLGNSYSSSPQEINIIVKVDNNMDGKKLADALTTKVTKAISRQQSSRSLSKGFA